MKTQFKVEETGHYFQGVFYLDGERVMATILGRSVEHAMELFEKCKAALIKGDFIGGKQGDVYVHVLTIGDPIQRKFCGSIEGAGAFEVEQLTEKVKFAVKQHIVEQHTKEDKFK